MSGRARHLTREDAARAALRVRELRRQRGWSQRDLAKEAGVAQATVSLIELGRVTVSLDVVTAVAGVLGLGPGDLSAGCARCGGSPQPWTRCLACGAQGGTAAGGAMDVAYADAPYVVHAERRALLLRMSPACWEDACHDCQDPYCICACEHPFRGAPVLCIRCRRPVTSIRHLTVCDPRALEARVEEITGMVGGGAT